MGATPFIPSFLKLFRYFYHGFKVCMSFGYNLHVIVFQHVLPFPHFFSELITILKGLSKCIKLTTLY